MTETPSSGSCRLQDASSVLLSSSNPALSLLPSTAEDCYQTLPSPYPLFTLSHILLLIIIIHCRHFSKSDFRSSIHTNPLPIHSLAAQQAAQAAQKPSSTTPSGIAQLRQASQSNSAAPASWTSSSCLHPLAHQLALKVYMPLRTTTLPLSPIQSLRLAFPSRPARTTTSRKPRLSQLPCRILRRNYVATTSSVTCSAVYAKQV